jgi:hypothetical protein
MASVPSESLDEARARFERTWRELRGNMGTRRHLGAVPVFKKLSAECASVGLKPCSALSCRKPIQKLSGFFKSGCTKDGMNTKCRACNHDPAAAAAARKRKREAEAAVEAKGARFSACDVEDEAREWLLPLLRALCLEARAAHEFRLADIAVRRPDWPPDTWMPVQLKSDGVFKKDGTTKPNDMPHSKAGCGGGDFNHCAGYEGMLVVFVKSRRAEGGGTARYAWVCGGGEIKTSSMVEHTDGTLGPPRLPPIDGAGGDAGLAAGVAAAVDAADPAWRRSWESIFLEVERETQQREVAGMLALRVAGFNVDFGEGGNQTAVDCRLSGPEEWMCIGGAQAKTLDIKTGRVNAHHFVNGVDHQPYSESYPLDALVEIAIVASGGAYYLLYAFQPRHALLYNGVFAHEGYRGKPRSSGKMTIYPPLGIFERWLTGETKKQSFDKRNEWLLKPSYNWRVPVEITPAAAAAVGLPWEWVEAHAKPAAAPGAFPSQAQLDKLQQRIEQSDAMLAAAARAEVGAELPKA